MTLSPYDRLSTALTVAQVTGVQSLCSHYAARLAPLHSPDASRESNIRLAQITQYARQLASQPTLICRRALQQQRRRAKPGGYRHLSQIIGFVSYQARVVAGIAALAGRPAVVVPGFPNVEDADGVTFSTEELSWTARLPPIDTEAAAAEQLDVLDQSHPQARAESYYLLLAHDAAALRERNGVFNGINAEGYGLSSRLKALATLAVSRINGSRYCAATVAQELQDDGLAQALFAGLPQGLAFTEDTVKRAVIHTAAELTRAPEKFTRRACSPCSTAA